MQASMTKAAHAERISFDTHPERYAHWRMSVDGAIATLSMNVNEGKGLRPGYKLKLNSYDLGVDIELYDALNRIRFEHPGVRCVVLTSARERMFCSGANIYMLGQSSHGWKVNFCKFTNETRNGMEDSSRNDGLKFLAAVNGTCAGGGYEIALACDEILMIDDRSSTVSLPEVPLLGVLPGTGGLTRITDKRKVRRDLADFFCTTTEGVRADRAKDWGLVDHSAKPQAFAQAVRDHAERLAAASDRPREAAGITLTPLKCTIDAAGYHYEYVDAVIDRAARSATLTVSGPKQAEPDAIEGIIKAGVAWWPLQMARELDDAILMLRTNELEIGTWQLKTRGDIDRVLAVDAALARHRAHWFVRETLGLMRRTLARLDVSSRTLFAIIDQDSCFAGTLAELALAADRGYMLQLPDDPERAPRVVLSELNFGSYPMVNHLTRLATRYCGRQEPVEEARQVIGERLDAHDASKLGLVTFTPDDLDWDEEVRIALEERASLSPDALTGMEASLRFTGAETMETRIFARLSAWQNWIFNRPNAVGEQGALKVFGSGSKAKFNWERI
ncbi:MAG: benzoyl-CoA-dihydrodiol lyase [Betaproteobacteria bacterium RIFCSPLOWO2_12_FULL_64_23]|nr:MAG: benzoyl-CoA-dihydrodiol lyase [Betaproteobacteria bacterium RIFCSPLOWO2_12_FULL_64_23]